MPADQTQGPPATPPTQIPPADQAAPAQASGAGQQSPASAAPATPSAAAPAPAQQHGQQPAQQQAKGADDEALFKEAVEHGLVTGDVKTDRVLRRFRAENHGLRARALEAEAKVAATQEEYKRHLVDARLRGEIAATLGVNPSDDTPEGKQRLALIDVLLPGARELVKPSVKFGEGSLDFTADFKPVVDLVKGSFGQAAAHTPSSGTSAKIIVPGIKPGSNGSAPANQTMPADHTHPASSAFVAALGGKR